MAIKDQMKVINDLRKAQKELKNEIVEVEAGDGAVVVQISGELKVKKVTNCFRDGYAKAQEIATDKMKPMMGMLGNLGL